tara:strand:+ start:1689 stop:2063 length:375 start_codon:yes stop_codon:yes gene_type:complete
MGRYYDGDISGKFAFAVQSSDDADFFGCVGEPPTELHYYFDEDHLKQIKKGIKECLENLGNWKDKLDKFFKENNGYNDKMLEDQIGLKGDKIKEMLVWYARLKLGKEILECVQEQQSCHFVAEC